MVTIDTVTITANSIKTSNGNSFIKPDDGNHFVGIEFSITNISDSEQSINSILCFDSTADDDIATMSFYTMMLFENSIDGTILPGDTLTGYYSVEIPKDTKELRVMFRTSLYDQANRYVSFLFELS